MLETITDKTGDIKIIHFILYILGLNTFKIIIIKK